MIYHHGTVYCTVYTCRCKCGFCVVMPTAAECVCCSEIDVIVQKMDETEADINCITEHEGFEPVCLNVWVLQAGFFSYRHHYGTHDIRREPEHE